MTTSIKRTAWGGALAACLLALCLGAFAPSAFANQHFDAPTTVSDDITRIHVNKLDADTHSFVVGATMAIIEKDTGVVVDEWVTGSGTHQNEKGLNVDVVYILRELAAPAGYSTVQDVEFVVNETEGTGITILSQGSDSELVESYKVNLYDEPIAAENVVTVSKERTTYAKDDSSKTNKTVAPKTGDESPLALIAVLVLSGIALIVLLQFMKRHMSNSGSDRS